MASTLDGLKLFYHDYQKPLPQEVEDFLQKEDTAGRLRATIENIVDDRNNGYQRWRQVIFAKLNGKIVGFVYYYVPSSGFVEPTEYELNTVFVIEDLNGEIREEIKKALVRESENDIDDY